MRRAIFIGFCIWAVNFIGLNAIDSLASRPVAVAVNAICAFLATAIAMLLAYVMWTPGR